jgi:hypothetical protein
MADQTAQARIRYLEQQLAQAEIKYLQARLARVEAIIKAKHILINKEKSDPPPSRQSSTQSSRLSKEGHNNQQDQIKCGYCSSRRHEEQDCRLKNHTSQPAKWQIVNASAIEYFKKNNEGRMANLKSTADLTPIMSATPSMPTPMANPNIGYATMTFSTTKQSDDEDPLTKPDNDNDTIRVIPRDTAILDPILRIVGAEAVGAATKKKKKDLNSLPSRAEVPKMRCGWSKKQSIVDPAVLLAWDLINSINQDKALSEDPNMWFCPFLASPNAKQWEAALEGG